MEIEPTTLGIIIAAVGGAVTSGIVGVQKLRKSKSNGHCADHTALCDRLTAGEHRFDKIDSKLDEQKEMIHSTSLDMRETMTLVKLMHEKGSKK